MVEKKRERITKRFVEDRRRFHKEAGTEGKYKDPDMPGFGIRVYASGKVSYILETKLNRKAYQYLIGVHGEGSPSMTADLARAEAAVMKGEARKQGLTPNEMKAEADKEKAKQAAFKNRAKKLTLRTVFNEYVDSKRLKPSSVYNYQCVLGLAKGDSEWCLRDWLDMPITEITKELLIKRHRQISDKHPGQADNAMRVMRAVFNFASYSYEDEKGEPLFKINPCAALSQRKQWNRLGRRKTSIEALELKPWFDAVMSLDDETARDYLLFVLFTGLRKAEASKLRWKNVNLPGRYFCIPREDAKNKESLYLPLSPFLHNLLLRRWGERASDIWVFAGKSEQGYRADVRKAVEEVTEASGVGFSLHDLRRTFATIAAVNLNLGAFTIPALLNHKVSDASVTQGYIVAQLERLREPVESIAAYILKEVQYEQKIEDNVVLMPSKTVHQVPKSES